MAPKPGYFRDATSAMPSTEDSLYFLRLGLRRAFDGLRDYAQATAILDMEAAAILRHGHPTPEDYARMASCRACQALNWADDALRRPT